MKKWQSGKDRIQVCLAGLYEFPNVEGHLKQKEVIEYAKSLGLTPVRVKKLPDAKHIFSHVEWQMKGYEVIVDELERELDQKIWSEQVIFAEKKSWKEVTDAICICSISVIKACRRNTWVQCVKAIGKDSLHVEYRVYSVFLKPIGICAILSAS